MQSVHSQLITPPFQVEADEQPATHDGVANWLLLSLPFALIAVFSQAIYQTAEVIVTSDDMAHGLFAPFISAIIAWEKRHDFRNALRPSAWGLLGLLVAGLLALAGTVGESATIVRVAGVYCQQPHVLCSPEDVRVCESWLFPCSCFCSLFHFRKCCMATLRCRFNYWRADCRK